MLILILYNKVATATILKTKSIDFDVKSIVFQYLLHYLFIVFLFSLFHYFCIISVFIYFTTIIS